MRAPVVIVWAVLAIAGPAHADKRPVAVIDLTGGESGRVLADELYRVLVDHLDLQALPRAEFQVALKGAFDDEDRPHVELAKKAKQQAEEALAQLDYRTASLQANTGMQELAIAMPVPEVLGLYAELSFADGQAQLGLRRPNEASRAFALAHRLDASKHPDPTRYEPGILDAYRLAANKAPLPAKLEVKGEGRVWIDGVEQGPANETYDTSEGVHLVQLSGPARETRGDQVNVPQQHSVEIAPAPATEELLIKRARKALRQARDAAARASAVKALAALLKVQDAVLVIAGNGGKLEIQTWRASTGFSRIVEHGREKPIELLTPLAPPRTGRSGEPFTPLVDKPFYKRTWVRVSAATVVVTAIVSAVVYAVRTQMIDFGNGDIKQWTPGSN